MRYPSLAVLVFSVLAVAGLPPVVIGGGAEEDAPTGQKSLKGWELYARLDVGKKAWGFGLLPATNRRKTAKEVADAITLEGPEALRKELSRLAGGETVLLRSRLPDGVRKEVGDLCTTAKLKFVDAGR
jgi:hypothetical protein